MIDIEQQLRERRTRPARPTVRPLAGARRRGGPARRGLHVRRLAARPAGRGRHAEGPRAGLLHGVPRRGRGARGAGPAGVAARARGARPARPACGASSTSTSRAAAQRLRHPDRLVVPRRLHARGAARHRARSAFGEVSHLRRRGARPRAARARSARRATRSGANPMPVVVPCHRVLRTGGALGGYTGGLERKEFLLRLEGTLL